MYFPFFQYGCSLEINSQRTAAYVQSASDTCGEGDLRSYIDMKCDCAPLHWVFDENDVPQPAVYTTPSADQAPWIDGSIPESTQFLGFMIEDVVQNVVASRTVRTRNSSSGGGTIGPTRRKERRYDFTVLMFACNEAAMEYGFRYLNDALNAPGCDDGCTLCDAEFRDSCPPVDGTVPSLNKGRWILKNVGAVDGPSYDTPPLEGSQCNIRRVKFSLASEMPWKFKCPVVECSDIPLESEPVMDGTCSNFDEWLCGTAEVSCAVSEELIIGETGLIIEVQAGTADLQHVEIAIRPDRFGYECDLTTAPVGYTRVDPCDLIYIPLLPASHRLVYDTSIESITVIAPGGGVYEGTPYVSTYAGRPPTFPTLRCGTFCISVAASACSVVGDATVSISSVHREI